MSSQLNEYRLKAWIVTFPANLRPPLDRKVFWGVMLSLALGVCAVLAIPGFTQRQQALAGSVHGIVAASLPKNGGSVLMLLPNVPVTVIDAASSAPRGEAVTTLAGRFATPRQPAGTYRVCAKAVGFADACSDPVTVVKHSLSLNQILVLKPQGAVLYGNVTLKDGNPGVRQDAGSTQGAAQVSVADASGHIVAGPVSVNATGAYVLPGVKPGQSLVLSARYEAATVSQTISVEETDIRAPKLVNLVLPSSAPVIESITMTQNGKPITTAKPGSTVVIKLGVKNDDPGPLHYRYSTNSSGLSAQDGPSVTWKLPTAPVGNILFFEVTNGYGGVLRNSVSIPVQTGGRLQAASSRQRSMVEQVRSNNTPSSIPAHTGFFIDPTALMNGVCSKEAACETEAKTYYATIDPSNALDTFQKWKQHFGFSANPLSPVADETRATYYNNADLQLGRDMHCRSQAILFIPEYFACYVSNYSDATGKPGGDPQDSIANAAANTGRIATVAMVWGGTGSHVPFTPDNLVQFYVYIADNPNDENDGSRVTSAVLDNDPALAMTAENKAVPGVCMTCHGGEYDANHYVDDATFLPFDTPSFIFSATQPSLQEPTQRSAFSRFNQLVAAISGVVGNNEQMQPVVDLVNGWYAWCGGTNVTGCGIDDQHPYYPDQPCPGTFQSSISCGWPDDTFGTMVGLYQLVPRRFCRTCHVALSGYFSVDNFVDWQQKCQLIGFEVNTHSMPFAQVPFNGFWTDTAAQTQLTDILTVAGGSACSE